MSDHEVTRGEYKDVMGSDPSAAYAYDKDGKELTGDDAKNNPVTDVSWYDALVYCNTRSIKENLTPCYVIGGKTNPSEWGEVPLSNDDTWDAAICDFTADGYRLPTEIEWEWAARGGESYTYAGSDNANEVAWYTSWREKKKGTGDVKSKKANGYGLYDMSGNVWEWCWNYDSGRFAYYLCLSKSSTRCIRGGSWDDYNAGYAKVAKRFFYDNEPYLRSDEYGFRVVRSASGTTSGSIEPVAENFVQIPGASIDGTEEWTPSSDIFVSGRKLEIASFYMSDHEVTRGEYKAVMGSDLCGSYLRASDKDGKELTGDDAKNNPVHTVNWYDALVYCNTRSIKEGLTPCYSINGKTDPKEWGSVPDFSSTSIDNDETWDAATCDFTADGYRLPTEAEWEWAARGGESYTYAGSDNVDEVAWYEVLDASFYYGTRDVKSKKANGYGLYDMSGNVWEWCWDWCGRISSDTSSTGPASGSIRCGRGGSWYNNASYAQVSYQGGSCPGKRFDYVTISASGYSLFGFRLVRSSIN